jgi:hypothetical protein
MSSLFVSGSVNISGTYKINGEDIATGTFDNKITGDLEFLENKITHGSISGRKEDGTHILKLKSEKVVVDVALEVDGTAYKGPLSVTTDEEASGEKLFGRDVYVKGYEGEIAANNSTINNFFPSADCRIVGVGGDNELFDGSRLPFPHTTNQYLYQNGQALAVKITTARFPSFARFWVKYTHE